MNHTVTLTLVKETKGALRYEGEGLEAQYAPLRLIGTLYLRKAGVEQYLIEDGDKWPQSITVTVEV